MSLLAAVGTCSYNGHTFNGSSRTTVRGKPLYDAADRTVVAMQWLIRVAEVIQDASATDSSLLTIRRQLSKPGQQLVYSSNGFGGLSINVSSAKDVMWGPKPRLLTFRPLGSSQAWEVDWECEVCVPECANAVYQNAPMAFNYEADYTIDESGFTTRIITGYLEIPMTRVSGGRTVPDSVDAYWERIVPTIPPGFERKERQRRVSADKRKLEFSIVDAQLPGGGFPPGITDFEGNHTTVSENMAAIRFISTLQASYIVAPGVPRTSAADHFYALAIDRSRPSKENNSRIFTGFKASEGLGRNRRITFEISWTYMSTIVDCLNHGGFFRQIPSADWSTWSSSEGVRQAQSPRGFAGMKLLASDDSILDLCLDTSTSTLKANAQYERTLQSRVAAQDSGQIDPTKSWLMYQCKIETIQNPNTARLKLLPNSKPKNPGMGEIDAIAGAAVPVQGGLAAQPQQVRGANNPGGGRLVAEPIGATPDTIQQRATPSFRTILRGYAVRAGFKIPLPKLVLIDGRKPTPSHQRAEADWVLANWSGVPIYARKWELEYDLDKPPDGARIEVPGNPAVQIAG